jgi:heat-inducible transcriptional repressor
MGDLSQRARKILFSCITEFIATGDPVGSRTLARKYGLELSAASIRNVLADLEEAGFLEQPHTSAGRIPTDRAFRLFIDALLDLRTISPEEQAGITERFAEIYAIADDPLRATAKHLSELSGGAAVIGAPRPELRALSQLRFIPTRPGQILAVLVFADGTVENRFVSIEGPLGDAELVRVHNLLADVIEGRSLGEVRDLFARRLADDRVELDALRRRAFELAQKATADLDRPAEVMIEGQARLIDLPEYGTDAGRLKKLMHALEEREELVALLDRTLVAGAVTVFVGSESGELGDAQLSLVVAPYGQRGRAAGTVGVIGPTRMDYAKVMPLVDATAAAMSQAIERGKGGGQG